MITRNQKANWNAFCSEPLELVENYQQAKADDFEGWCIHHRREIQQDGTRVSMQELKDKNLYYGRPASELIFMRRPEHKRLHFTIFNKGRTLSPETRQKIAEANKGKRHSTETRHKLSEALSGKNNPFFGKHHSAESCQKMSESHKGKHLSEETRKKLSESHKGKHMSPETRKKIAEAKKGENHPFFGKHLPPETRQKIAEAQKGKHKSEESRQKNSLAQRGRHWWNDGVSCKRAKECPGEGWTRGRLRFK